MLQLQLKNAIETSQAQADIATQQKKIESEMALAQQKFDLEKELKIAGCAAQGRGTSPQYHRRCGEGEHGRRGAAGH